MVWKIVILSIAIVIASFVIGGAIVAAQVLSGNVNIGDLDSQGNFRKNHAPVPGNATVVSIVANDRSDSYRPNPIEIKTGGTVTWVNDDSTVHTATANDDTFDSDVLMRGDTFSFTFAEAGEYPYYCDVHPNMVGLVVVTQGGEAEE
jgi:plastocyanin